MFGLQWIDRKYIAINSNTTPISDRFTCQKEVGLIILSISFLPENQNMQRIEFDDTGKEKISVSQYFFL